MNRRSLYYLGAGIGGTVASFVPLLWGAGELSLWSVLFSGLGGLAGIWLVYRFVS
jgi:hypothetical protein